MEHMVLVLLQEPKQLVIKQCHSVACLKKKRFMQMDSVSSDQNRTLQTADVWYELCKETGPTFLSTSFKVK